MRYFRITQTNTDCFEEECRTATDCIQNAQDEWGSMTKWEKKSCKVIAAGVPDNYNEEQDDGSVVSDIEDIFWSSEEAEE